MILSSADILRILGGDAIIRQEARLTVVNGAPRLGIDDTVYIYIDKYPEIDEFEATWKIWVNDASGMGEYVLEAMAALLPGFEARGSHYVTTDFASERTVVKTEAEKQLEQLQVDKQELQSNFSGLQKGLEERLGTIRDGRDGRDGKDGLDGRPGKDGRDGLDGRDGADLLATDAVLDDLQDVKLSHHIPLKKGQVLTWDGLDWTNLFVPQLSTVFAGGGSGGGEGGDGEGGDGEGVIISDTAPTTREDGTELEEGDQWWNPSTGVMYVWYVDAGGGQWVQTSGGDSGGGGSSTLAGLLDTDTGGVQDGEILVYRSETGNWTAENNTLDGLVDVDITTNAPEAGQALVWDGAQWVPGTVSGGSGGGGGGVNSCDGILDGGNVDTGLADGVDCIDSIDDLPDVDTSTITPGVGDALIWNGSYWAPGEVALDAPVDSVNGQTGAVVLTADSVGALESGDSVSELTNDAGYITLAEVPESGIPEAPQDGNYYVRQNGTWVNLSAALSALNDKTIDGGNLTTGSSTGNSEVVDGGNFS